MCIRVFEVSALPPELALAWRCLSSWCFVSFDLAAWTKLQLLLQLLLMLCVCGDDICESSERAGLAEGGGEKSVACRLSF